MEEKKQNVLLLIDASALIHRFFHALPPLTTPDGKPIQAIYGLTATLLKIFREQKPDYIVAALDRPEPTFRKEKFKEYKIHRPAAEDALVAQIIQMPQVFGKFGIPTFDKAGFEADDIIGTIVEKFRTEKNLKIIILSGDLDVLQLVENDKVVAQIIKTGLTNFSIYNEEAVVQRYLLKPNQLVDYKGLIGDASDNIPGVKGIGPKTAAELLREFKTIEEIFDSITIIVPKTAKKLDGQRDIAFLSKELATIKRDVPIGIESLKELEVKPLAKKELADYFTQLGFKSLIERLNV